MRSPLRPSQYLPSGEPWLRVIRNARVTSKPESGPRSKRLLIKNSCVRVLNGVTRNRSIFYSTQARLKFRRRLPQRRKGAKEDAKRALHKSSSTEKNVSRKGAK